MNALFQFVQDDQCFRNLRVMSVWECHSRLSLCAKDRYSWLPLAIKTKVIRAGECTLL